MDRYIEETEMIIGLIQNKMSEESFNKSRDAGVEMYESIADISEKHGLNIQELWNAIMNINLGITEMALESSDQNAEEK